MRSEACLTRRGQVQVRVPADARQLRQRRRRVGQRIVQLLDFVRDDGFSAAQAACHGLLGFGRHAVVPRPLGDARHLPLPRGHVAVPAGLQQLQAAEKAGVGEVSKRREVRDIIAEAHQRSGAQRHV